MMNNSFENTSNTATKNKNILWPSHPLVPFKADKNILTFSSSSSLVKSREDMKHDTKRSNHSDGVRFRSAKLPPQWHTSRRKKRSDHDHASTYHAALGQSTDRSRHLPNKPSNKKPTEVESTSCNRPTRPMRALLLPNLRVHERNNLPAMNLRTTNCGTENTERTSSIQRSVSSKRPSDPSCRDFHINNTIP